MANPFQDKFLKAGLVNKKQVNKAQLEQRKKQKDQRRDKGEPADRPVEQALRRQKEQSRQSNLQRDQAAREKEISAQIKQLVETNRVNPGRGDLAYHFADANKIKKLTLTKALVDQLSAGALGVVKIEEQYALVPAETARKIKDRCPAALLVLNEPKGLDPNDPYAEFPIPDDYEW